MSNLTHTRELARILASVLTAEQATPEELLDITAAFLALGAEGAPPSSAVRAARQILRDVREARAREVLRVRARVRRDVAELELGPDCDCLPRKGRVSDHELDCAALELEQAGQQPDT